MFKTCKTLKFRGTPKAYCYEPFFEKRIGAAEKDRNGDRNNAIRCESILTNNGQS